MLVQKGGKGRGGREEPGKNQGGDVMRNLSNAVHSLANGMGTSGNFCLIPPSFGIKSILLVRIKPSMNMAEGSKVTILL